MAGGSGTDEYLPMTLVKVGTHPNEERDTACWRGLQDDAVTSLWKILCHLNNTVSAAFYHRGKELELSLKPTLPTDNARSEYGIFLIDREYGFE